MSLAQQNFRQTPVAAASATVLSMPPPKASPAKALEADDEALREIADFIAPRAAKRKRSGYDTPDAFKRLVGDRMRQVREAAGATLTDAAVDLGYSQPVQLSVTENGERLPTLRVLVQYAASFGSTTDFLLGLSGDPEPDPAAVLQRHLSAGLTETFRHLLATVSATSVDLVRDVRPVAARALRLAAATVECRKALATVRKVNRDFDDACRGGAGLVARIDAAAELAIELLEETKKMQARAKLGFLSPALTQAHADESGSVAELMALLASTESQTPEAKARRIAATITGEEEVSHDEA